jgi:transposase
MEHSVGLDVSLEETAICVLDKTGKVIWRGRCSSDPDAIARTVRDRAPFAVRIGLETGQLSTWLVHSLRRLDLPVVCLDARHAKAALSLQVNKTTMPTASPRSSEPAGTARSRSRAWTARPSGSC